MQRKKTEWREPGAGAFLPPNFQNTVTDTSERRQMVPKLIHNPCNFLNSAACCPCLSVSVQSTKCIRYQNNETNKAGEKQQRLEIIVDKSQYCMLSSTNDQKKTSRNVQKCQKKQKKDEKK